MRAAITPLGGISNDQLSWQEQGRWEGRNEGIDIGRQQGLTDGYNQGYTEGHHQGYCAGSQEAHTAGYNEAIDEANVAIARLQAQHAAYQQDVVESYQAYEAECDKLKQLALNQAAQIRALEDKLVQREQATPKHQAKIDNLVTTHERLKQQNAAAQREASALTQQIQSLLRENAQLNEAVENLTLSKNTNQMKFQEQLAHYNKTLTFVNAIRVAVESLLEQNPALQNLFSKLFSDKYKKSIEFRILVDEIKAAPHEDSDFALLLPQTHEFILTMLKNEHRTGLSKSD